MKFRSMLLRILALLSLGGILQTARADCDDYPQVLNPSSLVSLWQGDFTNGLSSWGATTFQFGLENLNFVADPEGRFNRLLRAHYKAGSYDPGTAIKGQAPLGGLQFTSRFANASLPSSDRLVLSFAVRFRDGFNFVRGGKLPGLYGGVPRSGGKIPNGHDGFSTRVVWQSQGKGALYAYLPTSVVYGTVMGSGSWHFVPGKWMDISHAVRLNTPGSSNGEVAIWIDGVLVHKECHLTFRDTENLKIDGIFFSTFFDGNDPTWASVENNFVDFGQFTVSKLASGW